MYQKLFNRLQMAGICTALTAYTANYNTLCRELPVLVSHGEQAWHATMSYH